MEFIEKRHSMNTSYRNQVIGLFSLLILTAVAIFAQPATVSAAEVRLGIIMDVPRNERSQGFLDLMFQEMRKTLGASRTLRVDEADIRSLEWNNTQTMDHYHSLCGHCDMVVLLGSGAIHKVVADGAFLRPTLGLGVFEPQIQGIPYQEIGVSVPTRRSGFRVRKTSATF